MRCRERVWRECELRVLGGVLRGGVSVACVVSCGVFVGLCVWRVDSLKGCWWSGYVICIGLLV